MDRIPVRGRALTAVLLLFTFIVLIVSGIILCIAPSGRTAREIDWQVLLLGKLDWSSLHIVFGALFLIAAIVHIVFNRKPLASYIRERVAARRAQPLPGASSGNSSLPPWCRFSSSPPPSPRHHRSAS